MAKRCGKKEEWSCKEQQAYGDVQDSER